MRMELANRLFGTDIELSDNILKVYDSTLDSFRELTNAELSLLDAEVAKELIVSTKTFKLSELHTAYNSANQLDIAYMSTPFQADKDSQNLIVSVLSAGSVPTGFFWLDTANNQVAMTYTDLQGLSGAILARSQINFIKFQSLKGQVNLATTQADLDKIVW